MCRRLRRCTACSAGAIRANPYLRSVALARCDLPLDRGWQSSSQCSSGSPAPLFRIAQRSPSVGYLRRSGGRRLCNRAQTSRPAIATLIPRNRTSRRHAHTGETNMNNVTRSKVVQLWFAAIVFAAVACFALGLSVPLSTGVMLAVMSLVPPAVMLLLWPGTQPRTVADVLNESERRG
jgi:hypothetical protein